ncbi:MAG: hypothetical protein RKO66_20445, partial [Candidatus Contendobacter sp.]|nr:hypothetical protein [Candidatus Contendobacter sp.]MDS4058185.1 hypothetical protein [Candidatus Contendobacter sp.]
MPDVVAICDLSSWVDGPPHLAHAAAREIGGGEPVSFGNPGPDPERKPSDSECQGIIVDPTLIERSIGEIRTRACSVNNMFDDFVLVEFPAY